MRVCSGARGSQGQGWKELRDGQTSSWGCGLDGAQPGEVCADQLEQRPARELLRLGAFLVRSAVG